MLEVPGRERLTARGRSQRLIWDPGLPRPGTSSSLAADA